MVTLPNASGVADARSLTELLRACVEAWPDRPCMRHDDELITYSGLADAVERVATGLASLGLRMGDRLAVWLNNRPEWLVFEFAAARLGVSLVAVNTRLRREDLRFILNHSAARGLVLGPPHGKTDFASIFLQLTETGDGVDRSGAFQSLSALEIVVTLGELGVQGATTYEELLATEPQADLLPSISEHEAEAEPEVLLLYTSGTTSAPRAAVRVDRNLFPHVQHVADRLEMVETDVVLWGFPFCGTSGQVVILSTMAAGGCGLPLELGEPKDSYEVMWRKGCTFIPAADVSLWAWADLEERTKHPLPLRAGLSAKIGTTAEAQTISAMDEAFGAPFVQPYGMTEVNAIIASAAPSDSFEERACIGGRSVAPAELSLGDPTTTQSGDVVGEILVRGQTVLPRYAPPHSGPGSVVDPDGWFRTGDQGVMRDGRVYFTARLKDMLKINGFNVSPTEIEDVLLSCTGVLEAQVVACPHPERGQVPVAFVQLAVGSGLSEDQLRAYCSARVASFKVPWRVVPLDDFPVAEGTTANKIQRSRLRELAVELLSPISD